MTRPSSRRREQMLVLTCGTALALIILLIVGRDYPIVGHDFRYYIPRLLDTDLHIRINGMAVQWYTPTFGGGLPAFPNPQHLQHSALQALTYVVNPWLAVVITLLVVSIAGFYAFHAFLRRRLQLAALPSVLGAIFFVGNGFYVEHMIVGHVGFMLFPLAAVLLDAFTDTTRSVAKNTCIVALVLAVMVLQASVYLIILIALMLALTLPLLYLLDERLVAVKRLAAISAASAVLFVLMTASKMYAALELMRQFPREIVDVHDAGVIQGLAGLASQLVGAMVLVPAFAVAGLDITRVGGVFSKLVGSGPKIAIWELDAGLSPVLTLVLCVAAVKIALHVREHGTPQLTRARLVAVALLGVTAWVVVEAALAQGLLYPHIKRLPVLRSLHVNPRIAAVFILPLSLLGAVAVNRWSIQTARQGVLVAAIVIALASPLVYLLMPASMQYRAFDVTMSLEDYGRIRAGERFRVNQIADVSDAAALSTGSSSYRPYEPMFGYELETFAAETVPGKIDAVRDGFFNMTHPASLVFPDLNHLRSFERISAAEPEALEQFVSRRQPDWQLPPLLHVLNWVAVTSLAATLLGLGLFR